MASAKNKTITLTKTVQVEETRVILELTEEEANFLAAVTGMHVIGGSKVNAGIWDALYKAGYDHYKTSQAKEFSTKMKGRIEYNG